MSNWKDKKSFIGSTNYVEHEVGGEELKFFPLSVTVMFKLRRVALPLPAALSTLFAPNNTDFTVIQREFSDDGEGGRGKEIITEAISPQLAALRTKERTEALEQAIGALTDEQNAEVVGAVIMDCLREDFPRGSKENPKPGEFIHELDLPCMIECLKGVAKANREVLGPLADRVQSVIAPALDELQATETATAGSS